MQQGWAGELLQRVNPITAPATAVHVTERRTLSAGGALPVVLLVPGLLAPATLALRRRRRAPAPR